LPRVPADEARLEQQVLVNLIHNAIKFTPSGGRITVSAKAEGARLVVSVSDTGRLASRRTICRGCSNASTSRPARARGWHRAWGWPSPSTWWKRMAAASGWRVWRGGGDIQFQHAASLLNGLHEARTECFPQRPRCPNPEIPEGAERNTPQPLMTAFAGMTR